ncbi:PAS domain-containing protein [Chlorogloeopsis sp. ULAP01]|uniref:PAS domain-containing protein n=1 Tax=Chlorogloeopsis sp. ULAP01 TaxID=3056483 RepID=UPI0025AB0DA6|nr:PAS domain-containing protein [Chlorogloeopsis sp. ULAP01]MDM9381869.1 PAS domain-containing protein [Chlorogloeopsis sp. ULAP01]
MLTQRQHTILIVDDVKDNREKYRCYLTTDPDITYTILEAKSAKDTLALCHTLATASKSRRLDVILLKYHLSDGDGLEVLTALKAQLGKTCPPVVIIDGDNSAIAVQAIKGGAEDYLVQDQLTSEQLRYKMQSAIENAELRRALHESEERFRTSVENMLDCFGIYSAIRNEVGEIVDFRVEYVNAAACEANQMTKEQQLGKRLCELLPAHRESGLFAQYCQVVETGKPLVKESLIYSDIYRQKHLTRAFDIRVTKLEDGFVAAWRDITQIKRAEEEALQESERRFRAIFNSTFQFIGLLTVDGILIEANQTALDFGGLTHADVINRPFWEARWWTISPQTQEQLKAAIAQAASGEFVRYEVEVLGAGDQVTTIDFSLKPLRDQSGQVSLLIPEGRDISEQVRLRGDHQKLEASLQLANKQLEQRVLERTAQLQQANATIAEREATLRAYYDNAPMQMGVVELTENDIIHIYDNAATCRFFGREPGSTSKKLANELGAPPAAIQTWLTQYHKSQAQGKPVQFEYIHEDSQSNLRYLSVTVFPIDPALFGCPRFCYVAEDISERKRVEKALRQSEAQLQQQLAEIESIYQSAPVGLNVIDTNLRFVRINERLAQINGLPAPEHIGRTVREVLPHLADEVEPLLRQVLAGEPLLNVEIQGETPAQPGVQRIWLEHFLPLKVNDQIIGISTVCEEITDHKQREAELRQVLQKLNFHVENSPLGVIEWDRDFRVSRFSKEAERIFGWQAEELLGKRFDEWNFIFEEDTDEVVKIVTELTTGIEPRVVIQNRNYTKAGTVIDCQWYDSALLDESGKLVSVLSLVMDVSDRVRLLAERERVLQQEQAAREQAERANRVKDEFLAVLSHELRTPLNPILGWAKLLKGGKLNAQKTVEALNIIERNAKLQVDLIEDLLDVSRILQGKLTLNVSTINLESIISAAIETVRLAAETKEIQIQTIIEPNVGQVAGDPARLQQVVWNLLSNAVKFTPTGGRVEIKLERVVADAQITVTDTGKGINPKFLPLIFDYFRQEDASTTRKFGGLGLGLAIVRKLVELHGGTIDANSPGVGQGATFIVRLPLMTPHLETYVDKQRQDVSLDLSEIKILVVDDDADSRDFVSFVLELYGAEVIKAASASEALQILAYSKLDILISDIGMPDMDGYQMLRQIRTWTSDHGGQIPAIALTAYAGEFDQQQALTAGFQLHIPKPLEPEAVAAAVARLAGVIKK